MKVKVKVEAVCIPIRKELRIDDKSEMVALTVQYKFHWWQKYKYVYDAKTHVPRLFFSAREIDEYFTSMGLERA